MAEQIITTRTFLRADQEVFSRVSGDLNPMHMDAVAARRTAAGAPVVHGIHAFLWALEHLLPTHDLRGQLSAAKVQFKSFIHLDRLVELKLVRHEPTLIKAELIVDGVSKVLLTLRFGGRGSFDAPGLPDGLAQVRVGKVSAEPSFETMARLSGWLAPTGASESLIYLFPGTIAALGFDRVAALSSLSALVGMICPGLHSIFSGFSVTFTDATGGQAGAVFKTTAADERFKLLTMAVTGAGLIGKVFAYVRPAPVASPSMKALASLVRPDEFAGIRALVVGGTRGLGAATAKLLAAGGGRVVITYASGRADAQELMNEIVSARGEGSCTATACDVNDEIEPQLKGRIDEVDHLYYFASPQIFRVKRDLFSQRIFDEFIKFYVERFYDTVRFVSPRARTGRVSVFYPSSVSVESRPRGMTEYSMAKLAGEVLCADLAREQPQLHVVAARIPRVRTDQTASVIPVESADATSVMLPLIRSMT